MSPRYRRLCVVALFAAATQAGCAGDDAAAGSGVTRETLGDTTVVRVTGDMPALTATEELRIGQLEGADEYTFGSITDVAVGADDRIYALDMQALNVRVFSPAGEHVKTFGRAGAGPGELKQPGGMAFLSDGRLVVRDPANTRMNVYSADGESLTTWPIPGGFFTSAPLLVDEHGGVYIDVIVERDSATGASRQGLLRIDSAGVSRDTLRRPFHDFQVPTVRAERVTASGSSRTSSYVPFWHQPHITLNRRGEFVGGISDRYAIHTWRRDGTVQRVEHEMAAVAVDPAEAQAAVERTSRNMRRLEPAWKWSGPQPPASKPFFRGVRVAEDGRLWVLLSQPGRKLPPDPDAPPDPSGLPPLDRWQEPSTYDVFEEDGTPVGRVTLPDRFRPTVIRGDQVWGVASDELDVQYIVRLKIAPQT